MQVLQGKQALHVWFYMSAEGVLNACHQGLLVSSELPRLGQTTGPGACAQIAGDLMDLTDEALRCLPLGNPSYHVELELEPVGASFIIQDDNELQSLVASLLSTLRLLHAAGYVHRDIRMDNIVKYFERWLLIDWEVAGRVDQEVWWEGKLLPDPVRLRQHPYTVQTDLWQVGMLIMSQESVASPAAKQYAQQLVSGAIESAAQAECHMWPIT